MDINFLFKILLFIVAIGISMKAIKLITGVIFKISLVIFIPLLLYKMFI